MEINIEDYLDEASTHSLVSEIKSRKGWENAIQPPPDKRDKIDQIRDLLGLKSYSTKEEIIKEINEL